MIFHPAIHAVHDRDGFITGFAGDAFTAVFPTVLESTEPETLQKALAAVFAAQTIQHIFEQHGRQTTQFGVFELHVKIGLAYGDIQWGIVGPENHKAFYFKGSAIDGCASAERRAHSDQIVLEHSLAALLPAEQVTLKSVGNHYFLLQDCIQESAIPEPARKNSLDIEIASIFYSSAILEARQIGEFRDIACVFISFEETIEPSELDRFISSIIKCIDRFSGHFNRVDFGDKGANILVFFGAPESHENDLDRALRFVLTAKSELSDYFSFRAGINCGRVYAGMIGIPLRCEYATIGRAVTLAARLMMQAERAEILIPESIASNPKYHLRHKGNFVYKGIENEVPTFQLMGEKTLVERFYTGELIGREREMDQLIRLLKPITEGKFGGVIYVDGLAGAGKSRIVNELRLSMERGQGSGRIPDFALRSTAGEQGSGCKVQDLGIKWFYMPCEEILRKSFNPIVYFFKDYFKQSEENTMDANRTEFEYRMNWLIEQTQDHDIGQELIRTRSILGGLLNLHWEDSLYEQLDAKGKHENTLYAIKNLIKAESLIQPVVLELEDGHWIDSDTQACLEVLTRNVGDFPFIVISACRCRDDGSNFQFGLKLVKEQRVRVGYLDAGSSRALMQVKLRNECAPSCTVPESTLDFLFKKSEGNPFFIEQICLYLLENKLLDSQMNLKTESVEIPSSINAVIMARIDRLTTEMKEVIKTASVLGREFAAKILCEMLKNLPVDRYLLEGEKETIWTALNELRYIFKHALIRDAVYQMQLKQHIRVLHKLAAETIENLYQDDLESHYFDLADHYEKSGIEIKMFEYLEKAGEHAVKTYQNQKAIEAYSKLISFLPDTDERKSLNLLNRGDMFKLIGQPMSAKKDYEQAMIVSRIQKSRKVETNSIRKIGSICSYLGQYDEAMQLFQHSLQLAEELCDRIGKAGLLLDIGNHYYNQNRYEESLAWYQQALLIYKNLGFRQGESDVIGNIGHIYFLQNRHAKALIWSEKALKIQKEIGDRLGEASSILNFGHICLFQDKYGEALKWYQHALQIYREIGSRRGELGSLGNIGNVNFEMGNYEEALTCLQQSLELSRTIGDNRFEVNTIYNIGKINSECCRYDEALKCFQQSSKKYLDMDNRHDEANSIFEIGLIHLFQKKHDEAERHFNHASTIYEDLAERLSAVSSRMMQARALFCLGVFEKANSLSHKCLTLMNVLDPDRSSRAIQPEQILFTHYLILNHQNDPETATYLEQAYQILKEETDRITDPNKRLTVLNSPMNRPIMEAWESFTKRRIEE